MNNQKRITALIKAISGQANILTIPRIYIELMNGDIEAALFLSQCVYWSDKTSNPEGWFYKSYKEWYDELGMTQFKVKRVVDMLKEKGFIETKLKRANNAPTIHYRVKIDYLSDSIIKFLDNQESSLSGNSTIDNEETQQSDYEETSQTLTETTIDYAYIGDYTPKQKPRTPEEIKNTTLEALARGVNRDLSVKEEIEKHFHICPNWDTKTGRAFIQWLKERPAVETVAVFASWWYSQDWRGKGGQPPTLGNIRELWPQAFIPTPASEKLKGYSYA